MAFAPVFGRPFAGTFDRHVVGAPPAANWWEAGGAPTPVAVYQPKGAASLAASYVNLANPGTYDAAPGIAYPSWSSAGWATNGVDQYLMTGVVASANYTALIKYAGMVDGGIIIGARDWNTGAQYCIEIQSWGGRFFNGGTTTLWDNAYTGAVKALAGRVAYTNGVVVGTSPDTDDAPAFDLYIGARHNVSIADEFTDATIEAVAIWDTSDGHATWVPAVSAAVALI